MPPVGGSAAFGSENQTTAPAARGNTPLLPPVAASPPEGEILAALRFEMLMRQAAERRANFPLRGKWCAAPKGVPFLGRSPVVWFSLSCCHKLKLPPLPSTHSPTALAGWQRNWICRGASRPENPVTCFPTGQRWWRQPPKGARRQAAFILIAVRRYHNSPPFWYYVPPFPRKRWHNEPSGRKPRQSLEPFPLYHWEYS